MKTAIILSTILFGLVAAKCSNAGNNDNLPKDFRVTLHDGGGMSRQGANYFLSLDSSYAEMWESDAKTKIYFKASMKELKKLYKVIQDNSFHAIETYEEMVYDRGGTTIDVRADGDSYQIRNGGMTFIKENWRNEWQAVEDEIRGIVASHLKKMEKVITIKFADSFMDEDKIVNFNMGDYVYMSARDGWQNSVTVTMLPGEHYAYFTMMNKELTTEPGAKIFAQGQGVINVAEDTDTIYIYREGKEIMWK
jgi:hypothetical protein